MLTFESASVLGAASIVEKLTVRAAQYTPYFAQPTNE
jgi:hypothetical protein